MKKVKLQTLIFTALCTALICILGPLTIVIPVSPVPISLSILAIYISVYVLGFKWATAATALYILIGLVGVPVFSGFSGGPGKLVGPTGGYIFGYLAVTLISGLFIDKFYKKIYMHAAGMVLGTAVCYAFGTLWLAHEAHMGLKAALMAGVVPFIPADIVKIIIALLTGPILRRAIKKIS